MKPTKERAQLATGFLALLAVTCSFGAEPKENPNNKELSESLLNDVLESLMKVVQFLVTDYSEINVDGLFGFRLCQGNLIGTLQDCSQDGFTCPRELTDKLRDIIGRLNDLADQALPYIREQDEDYYNTFLPTIEALYMVKYIPEGLRDFNVTAESNITYPGLLGNNCFGDIMGTFAEGGKTAPPCIVTDDCWQIMTAGGTVGYYTTHQLLFFIYSEHTGCENILQERFSRHNGTSVRDFERYLCQQIYFDATFRDEGGKMAVVAEDLFLEQTLLCGILGFQYFLREKWMRMVLSWQTARGCFTNPAPLVDIEELIYEKSFEIYNLQNQLLKEGDHMNQERSKAIRQRIFQLTRDHVRLSRIQQERHYIINRDRGVRGSRKLLSEKVMGGDCLAHKTGLGAGTLGLYVRYLARHLYGYN